MNEQEILLSVPRELDSLFEDAANGGEHRAYQHGQTINEVKKLIASALVHVFV